MRIPDPGLGREAIFARLEQYREHDTPWREGRTWAYVYDPGPAAEAVIHDAFAMHTGLPGGSHSQGVYTSNVRGILIEENVLDHNGHNPDIAGAEPTIFNHNLYIQTDSDDLVVRGNIIARAASNGLQARPGGIVEDNLFLDNSIAMFIAGDGGSALDNVVLHGSTNELLPDGNPRAWGIDMKNITGVRDAGSSTAAAFIGRFIKEGQSWAHLDIAGMAWTTKDQPVIPKGATGFGVRLLDEWIRENHEA